MQHGLKYEVCSVLVLHVAQNHKELGLREAKLFLKGDIIKVRHPLERRLLNRPRSRQTQQPARLRDPAPHPHHYTPVQVCGLHGQQHILHTTAGDGERLNGASKRLYMRHEKKFEVFARPKYTILHARLLHCSEEFARPTYPCLMPMARHPLRPPLFKLWNLVP
jgi:hypothetical protein